LDPFERAGDQSHIDLLENNEKSGGGSGRTLSGRATARKTGPRHPLPVHNRNCATVMAGRPAAKPQSG
ncbi:MAG: hypothetical protein ABW010_06370, partial [Methyloceanibacter sp.]